MEKFELGIAFRGTTAPELNQVVEANSMREAMLAIINQYGGDDVVLVTRAHYFEHPEAPQPDPDYGSEPFCGVAPFMLVSK